MVDATMVWPATRRAPTRDIRGRVVHGTSHARALPETVLLTSSPSPGFIARRALELKRLLICLAYAANGHAQPACTLKRYPCLPEPPPKLPTSQVGERQSLSTTVASETTAGQFSTLGRIHAAELERVDASDPLPLGSIGIKAPRGGTRFRRRIRSNCRRGSRFMYRKHVHSSGIIACEKPV